MFLNPPELPSGPGILHCNVSWCRLLGFHLINIISVLPETKCLFPFPNWGSFQLLLFQMSSPPFSLSSPLEPLIPERAPWSQHCAPRPASQGKARPMVGLGVHLAVLSSTAEAWLCTLAPPWAGCLPKQQCNFPGPYISDLWNDGPR